MTTAEKRQYLKDVHEGKIKPEPSPILFVRQEKSLWQPEKQEFIEVDGVLCPDIPDVAIFIDTRTEEYLTHTQITALLKEKYKGYGAWYCIDEPSYMRFAPVSSIHFEMNSGGVYQYQRFPEQGLQPVRIEKFSDIIQQQECFAEIRIKREKSCS